MSDIIVASLDELFP